MRNYLVAALAAITSLSMNVAEAASRHALWNQSKYWIVTAYPDRPVMCIGVSQYPRNGYAIGISLDQSGWSLSIGGVSTSPGKSHTVRLMTSNGAGGTLVGTGISDSSVTFEYLTSETIINIARARSMVVEGLGTFRLNGSAYAIDQVVDCYQSLK